MPALPFDARDIEELVLRLNAVTAKEGMDVPDPGGNATDDQVVETLQEVEGDLSRDEITQEIESMNDEQKDGLVALSGSAVAIQTPKTGKRPRQWPASSTMGWSAAICWGSRMRASF